MKTSVHLQYLADCFLKSETFTQIL